MEYIEFQDNHLRMGKPLHNTEESLDRGNNNNNIKNLETITGNKTSERKDYNYMDEVGRQSRTYHIKKGRKIK